MATDTVPAAVPGPPEQPGHTAAGDQSARGFLASMVAPVEPARPTFTLAPTTTTGDSAEGADGVVDRSTPGMSSASFRDADEAAAKDPAGAKRKAQGSIWKAWWLAGAQRWAKGGGTANKRLDLKKARAQANQIKENRTTSVTKSGGLPVRNSGGSGLGSKGGNGKSGGNSGGKGPVNSGGHRSNGAGRGGSGGGRGPAGGAGHSGSHTGGRGSADKAKHDHSKNPKPGSSGKGTGGASGSGASGAGGTSGKHQGGGGSAKAAKGDTHGTGGRNGAGKGAGLFGGSGSAGGAGKKGADGKPGAAGKAGTTGSGATEGTGKGGKTPGKDKHAGKKGHAPGDTRTPLEKAREVGHGDGSKARRVVDHVKAYADGTRDGWTDEKNKNAKEHDRLDKAHDKHAKKTAADDDTKDGRTKPAIVTEKEDDGVTTDVKPLTVKNIDANTLTLGTDGARTSVGRRELRNFKQYERKLEAKETTLQKIAEACSQLEKEAELEAKECQDLAEQAKSVKGGEKLGTKLNRLAEAAKNQAVEAAELTKRAKRAAEMCKVVLTNIQTRYQPLYKAVVDSDETKPAELRFYNDKTSYSPAA